MMIVISDRKCIHECVELFYRFKCWQTLRTCNSLRAVIVIKFSALYIELRKVLPNLTQFTHSCVVVVVETELMLV